MLAHILTRTLLCSVFGCIEYLVSFVCAMLFDRRFLSSLFQQFGTQFSVGFGYATW
eukprot:m.166829 g.166829  ORF g.166829 m.166829 type:complete len:56 (-) comp14448_c2_seq1:2172-2339(-)